MSQKKYASLSTLQIFLNNLKNTFSSITHKHTIADITDYTVDTELSPTSINPVANSTIDAEFEAVGEALGVLEVIVDNKLNSSDLTWDNIDNKPFSTTVNGTVILSSTTVEESDDGHGIGRGSTGRFSEAVVSGEEYKVVFDGTEYHCVAYTDPIMNDYVVLGNFTVVEPITGATNHADTGEPFLICYSIIYKYAGVYTPVIDSHTISVIRIDEVIENIDESCIPNTIARVEDIPSIDGLATEAFVTEAVSENLSEAKAYTDTVANGKSDSNHNHDSDYADIDHNHDDIYAVVNHNHDDKYDNKGAASSAVSTHNTSDSAHNDIRILITELTTKLNNFLDVDDTTTDQLSELIALIQDNATDIEVITSGKVNVSDIIDNLTTNVANKPLSAAQGVAIKSLIDDLQTAVDGKADLVHIHPYGVCSSSATYTTKTVTVENFSLVEGARVIVKFTNANEASSPKLNVNGTGAIPIMRYGTTAVGSNSATNGWEAGAVLAFTYDGTNWVRDYWYNTTYTNIELGQGFGYCYTSSSVADKEVTMSNYEAKTGGIVSVKFSYSVDAGEITMNINGEGAKAVNYMGSDMIDDVIKGGDIATFIYTGSTYHLISVDRWFEDIAELQANDSRVRQMPTSTNGNFRLLLTPSFQSEETTAYTYFNTNLYANPYSNKIYADISGTSTGVKGVTAGNFLVGNGSNKMTEKTPSEVLSLINGASVAAMTTAEYNALETKNANTLYMLTDADDVSDNVVLTTEQSLTEEQKLQARNNIGIGKTIADTLFTLDLIEPLMEDDGEVLVDSDGTLLVTRNEDIFLPEVTEDNNGSVLTVENGKWVAAAFEENEDMIAALDAAIANKADKSELFSGSWNDLKDKPFYNKQTVIDWDGNIEDKDMFALVLSSEASYNYYKLSDDIPTINDLVGGTVTFNGETLPLVSDFLIPDVGCYYFGEPAFVVIQNTEASMDGVTITPPSTGIYFMHMDGAYVSNLTYGSTKMLDEKFIPDTIARVSNSIPIPLTATVGQTIVVKAVDSNGKPIEWEAVDPWVMTSTTEGSTKQFKITIDDEGVLTATEIVESVT